MLEVTDKSEFRSTGMITIVETIILCIVFFLLCYIGTGTDEKNLRSYSSYPDKVQDRIKNITEYQGRFKENNKAATFLSNFYCSLLFYLYLVLSSGKRACGTIFWH